MQDAQICVQNFASPLKSWTPKALTFLSPKKATRAKISRHLFILNLLILNCQPNSEPLTFDSILVDLCNYNLWADKIGSALRRGAVCK